MAFYSKRIGSKTLMVSDHPENPNLCYKWTKSGKPHISGLRYVCAGCRKLRDAKQVAKETPLPTRKLAGDKWADDGPSTAHFCQPFERTKVQGEEERRKVQAELAMGSRENVASAKVRIETRVAQKYSDKGDEERNRIRDVACGNRTATKQALYRASTKRFTNVCTLHGLTNGDCRYLWVTLRGRSALPGSAYFDEMLMRHIDEELAIFSSPRQLQLLKKSAVIVSDGTFKQAPKGIYQVQTDDAGVAFQRLIRNSIGPDFFSLFNVPRHRTINHAESYHGRQRWFYQPHLLLGRWLVNFQEVSHAEEESAVAIDEGRQQPNQPLAMTAEIDANIEREKTDILAFLNTDEQFAVTMARFFGRVGHLVGFNAPPRAELDEQMQEAAAMEEAEASLDESGIIVEENDEENINPN